MHTHPQPQTQPDTRAPARPRPARYARERLRSQHIPQYTSQPNPQPTSRRASHPPRRPSFPPRHYPRHPNIRQPARSLHTIREDGDAAHEQEVIRELEREWEARQSGLPQGNWTWDWGQQRGPEDRQGQWGKETPMHTHTYTQTATYIPSGVVPRAEGRFSPAGNTAHTLPSRRASTGAMPAPAAGGQGGGRGPLIWRVRNAAAAGERMVEDGPVLDEKRDGEDEERVRARGWWGRVVAWQW